MTVKTRTVTSKVVFDAAVRITEEKGISHLNVQSLSSELGLKPASLYNHIENIDEAKAAVAKHALSELDETIRNAAIGYSHEKALLRVAHAARKFAAENPELYNASQLFSIISPTEYKEILGLHSNVVHQILDTYELDEKAKINFIIALRSALHGFISLEAIGAFGGISNTDIIFDNMINHNIKMLVEVNDDNRK